jgi:phosphoglycolate phosphatase
MSGISVYLFDVDGTLLDSAADIYAALREVLDGHPVRVLDEALVRRYIGYHLLEFFRDVLPGYSEEQHWELIQRYREIYPARGHRLTRVYPGVKEMLERLPGRKATATTKSTATVRSVLEQFGLLPYFDHPQGTDGFPAKPAPDVIHAALAALGARRKTAFWWETRPRTWKRGVAPGYGSALCDTATEIPPNWLVSIPITGSMIRGNC